MRAVAVTKIPSPADAPTLTARELIERIRAEGGRVLRMKQEPSVFVLTGNAKLAEWLYERGGTSWTTRGANVNGSYLRAREGIEEWDTWIHTIPVLGEETIWGAAGR